MRREWRFKDQPGVPKWANTSKWQKSRLQKWTKCSEANAGMEATETPTGRLTTHLVGERTARSGDRKFTFPPVM